MVVKSKQVCELFGISKATLSGWRQAGAAGQLGRDQWDLGELIQWHIETMTGQGSEEMETVKLEYWQAKRDRERIKADTEAGELIPRLEVVREWSKRLAVVVKGLEHLANRVSGQVVGLTSREKAHEIISAEVRQLREGYATQGPLCVVPEPIMIAINEHIQKERTGNA